MFFFFLIFRSMNDPRLIQCLGVLLGIDLQHMDDGEYNDSDTQEPSTTSEPSDKSSSEPKTSSQSKTSNNSSSKPNTELTGDKKQVE